MSGIFSALGSTACNSTFSLLSQDRISATYPATLLHTCYDVAWCQRVSRRIIQCMRGGGLRSAGNKEAYDVLLRVRECQVVHCP